MTSAAPEFEFDVPATTAHLGPGYGVLGLALDLTFRVSAMRSDVDGIVIERRGESVASGASLGLRHDAILRGLRETAERFAIALPKGLAVQVEGAEIPRGCGLGTNSADFAAGAGVAVRFAKPTAIPKAADVLTLLADLGCDPGHGAAALVGGLALAVPASRPRQAGTAAGSTSGAAQDGALTPQRPFHLLTSPIDPAWRFIMVAPEAAAKTADVHRVLPASLPHAIVPRTSARLAGLLHALRTGDEDLAADCLVDESHVPFRLDIVPGMREAILAAGEAGAAGATISGHGPAVLALTTDPARTEGIHDAMHEAFSRHGVVSASRICEAGPTTGALSELLADS